MATTLATVREPAESTIRADWLEALCRLLRFDITTVEEYRTTLRGLNKEERRIVPTALADKVSLPDWWRRVNQSL